MAQDHRHPSRLATGLSALLAATAGAGPFVLVTTETAQAVEVSARSHSTHLSAHDASERRKHRAEKERERRKHRREKARERRKHRAEKERERRRERERDDDGDDSDDDDTPATPTPAPTPTPSPTVPTTAFTGTAASYDYGSVTVTIKVGGGRIVAVSSKAQNPLSHSRDINATALPKLDAKALAAQSASITAVSGATLTTAAYKKSLQSALTKAGL